MQSPSQSSKPVLMGGQPVRSWAFQTTPLTGQLEMDYLAAWLATKSFLQDSPLGGLPVAAGLTVDPSVRTALSEEGARAAIEYAALQGVGVTNPFVAPVVNGTHAIRVGFGALAKCADDLGLQRFEIGDEVLTPSITWVATQETLLRRGLVPVIVDVDPLTLCMDVKAAEAAITPRTRAILAVHLYSRVADPALIDLCDRNNLAYVEDNAQGTGAVYTHNGVTMGAGYHGVFGTVSLQGSKTLSCGEGGFLLCKSRRLHDQFVSQITCSRPVGMSTAFVADNDRMSGPEYALLRAQMQRFPDLNAGRATLFAQLDQEAAALPGMQPLAAQPFVQTYPTYVWIARFNLGDEVWGGMTLNQIRANYHEELKAIVQNTYPPVHMSPFYQPHTDDALHINDDFWQRIDPTRYPVPNAINAHQTCLEFHATSFALDPQFPAAFVEATAKIQRNAKQLALLP